LSLKLLELSELRRVGELEHRGGLGA
jgi:hypothetical protein